ncbi:MAG: SAVED domain-containing protein [Candidatus Electrothrix sp. GW3-4]|uniref:SAVED domain-containing protein n=1 Tax=Candidatus Electrothrix sp. GW3-4 TaxID=3126740 RepID=UPI0030CEC4FC
MMNQPDNNKNFLCVFIDQLWGLHGEVIVIFPVTVLTIITNSINNNRFIWLDYASITLLVSYLLYVIIDTMKIVYITIYNVSSGYSICLGKKSNYFKDSVRKQRNVLKRNKVDLFLIEKEFKIIDIDWQYYDEPIRETKSWQDSVENISDHFFRYAKRIPIETKLHLFTIAQPAVLIGVGYAIGKERDWVVYHYCDSTSSYVMAPNLKGTQSRSSVKKIKFNEKIINEYGDITVILSFTSASRIPFPDITNNKVEVFPKGRNKYIEIEDMSQISYEINEVLTRYTMEGRTIHLFPGLPCTLAFILGKLLHENSNIIIYNPNDTEPVWERVIDIQNLDI